MNLKQFFINPAGRLRSGWRMLIFVLLFVVLLMLMGFAVRLASPLFARLSPSLVVAHYLENFVARLVLLVAALLAGYICTRWLEALPWRALGLWLHSGWLRDLFLGSLIGVLSLALATAIATAGGGLSFTISGRALLLQVGQTL